ncbi:MAG: SOS response-associated peptidase family protein [Chromatiaceae bacterium]
MGRSPAGQALESCTVIVTDANALVRVIHDRMPVILERDDYAAWLDPDNGDTGALTALLRPVDPGPWTLHPVSRLVNSPRNDSPDLLRALDG